MSTAAADKQWFGQPRGLATLFFTEMWERFSFYGMRGLLILFMVDQVNGMSMEQPTAAAIYGLYTGFVYLLALPGGWIADRVIGAKNAVFFGGILIAAGHFSMAIPSDTLFFVGLVLIILGTGLLKPNVSTIVGELYPEGGAQRDAGFSIFYMGINLGAFAGPIICGWLGEKVGWHWGFSAAGIGMVAGLIQYKLGDKYLSSVGSISTEKAKGGAKALSYGLGGVVGLTVLMVFLQKAGTLHLTLQGVAESTTYIIVGLAVAYFAYQMIFGGFTSHEKKRLVVIFILFLAAAAFWAGFEQAGSSMNIFADQSVDRVFFGREMPTSWLQSVNPIFIILLAPVFGQLWLFLGAGRPSIPMKFGIGLVLLGIGFFVVAWGASYAADGTKVSALWLVMTYFFHTAGELCLSPVGLSSVTKLAPKRLVGQMMGIWFMGTALGNVIAGLAAGEENAHLLFSTVARNSIIVGVIMLLFAPLIKRLIGNLEGEAGQEA